MERKVLGKITSAEFGFLPDYPNIGLILNFEFDNYSCIGDGGKYTVNTSDKCNWSGEGEKIHYYKRMINHVQKTLQDAKVNYVSQLIGKPVEITIDGIFKDFRILTEVI